MISHVSSAQRKCLKSLAAPSRAKIMSFATCRIGGKGQHIGLAPFRDPDGLLLVLMQEDWSARVAIGGLFDPEDALALRVQEPFPNEVADVAARHERRIELHQGGGPEALGIVLGIDMPLDVLSPDADEGSRKSRVGSNQPVAKRENVHLTPKGLNFGAYSR